MSDKYKIPASVKAAAKRALEIRKELPPSERGMTSVGIARAVQLSTGDEIDLETVKKMYAFFSRHKVDLDSKEFKEKGWKSKGGQGWLGWGGHSGYSWVKRILGEK